jgi:hypothetical protein
VDGAFAPLLISFSHSIGEQWRIEELTFHHNPRCLTSKLVEHRIVSREPGPLAKPKEPPPRKTEDEDELEDDYDWGTKGEERGAIKQAKLYSPTRRFAHTSLQAADTPTRRFADPFPQDRL